MDLGDRRDTYNGFGDALAKAVELTVTPAIFGLLGWLLDDRLGTTPLFTVVLTLFTFCYVAWRLWTGYEASMQRHERQLLGHDGPPDRSTGG